MFEKRGKRLICGIYRGEINILQANLEIVLKREILCSTYLGMNRREREGVYKTDQEEFRDREIYLGNYSDYLKGRRELQR